MEPGYIGSQGQNAGGVGPGRRRRKASGIWSGCRVMKAINLQYVAHVTILTSRLKERLDSDAATVGEMINELEICYPGFSEMFIDPGGHRLRLNSMIYYKIPGGVTSTVI